ncbi:hypothetical protein BB558_003026 [Smittium angustum]|uniref:peptidylprolyl isomerase n=1 Tax=Smittium angustum TaxID=133377 RepID=A0A2U1IXG5_SMIAN|nr:hypothetical protein BB558_006578 [Smittium angustum]PWA00889.1 hypothetical protein BB558_003026 [Smittium angustum]
MVNPRVFFDVSIGNDKSGRIVFELFKDVVPKTVENFRVLCSGEFNQSLPEYSNFNYKNTRIHRVIKGFVLQGGDISKKSQCKLKSIYGDYFQDENFTLKHDGKYLLSMANKGPDTNGTQFLISTGNNSEHLNDKNVVFGKVIHGFDVIHKIESLETRVSRDGTRNTFVPIQNVTITHSGELELVRKLKNDSSAADKSKSFNSDRDSSDSSYYSSSESSSYHKKKRLRSREHHSSTKNDYKLSRKHKRHESVSDSSSSSSESSSSSIPDSDSELLDKVISKSENKYGPTPRSRWEDDRYVKHESYETRRNRLENRQRSYYSAKDSKYKNSGDRNRSTKSRDRFDEDRKRYRDDQDSRDRRYNMTSSSKVVYKGRGSRKYRG